MKRVLFVAGATGAVGRTVVRLGDAHSAHLLPHLRPKKVRQGLVPPPAAVFDLGTRELLVKTLRECTTVLQLIGTMRSRFDTGDTYETSDIGTTRQLVEAAKEAGTIDHLVLLSSVGAGRPVGAYLKAKAEAERLVRESGIAFTVLRPSAFMGEGHSAPVMMQTVTKLLGAARYQPIRVEDLARTLLYVAEQRAHLGEVLEGETLWAAVREAASA